jgi:hypothetical protein
MKRQPTSPEGRPTHPTPQPVDGQDRLTGAKSRLASGKVDWQPPRADSPAATANWQAVQVGPAVRQSRFVGRMSQLAGMQGRLVGMSRRLVREESRLTPRSRLVRLRGRLGREAGHLVCWRAESLSGCRIGRQAGHLVCRKGRLAVPGVGSPARPAMSSAGGVGLPFAVLARPSGKPCCLLDGSTRRSSPSLSRPGRCSSCAVGAHVDRVCRCWRGEWLGGRVDSPSWGVDLPAGWVISSAACRLLPCRLLGGWLGSVPPSRWRLGARVALWVRGSIGCCGAGGASGWSRGSTRHRGVGSFG